MKRRPAPPMETQQRDEHTELEQHDPVDE
jgi:hypothetical protein